MSARRCTAYGIAALILWSTIIGLLRSVTEAFGVEAGSALVYSVGALALCLKRGIPKLRSMRKAYLLGAGAAFVLYEIVLSQGVGLAENARQALEVGMLNYLWPILMVVFSIWINGVRLRWWVWPGMGLALAGIYACITAGSDITLAGLYGHVTDSPWPYILGLTAGVSWALYCNLSTRFSAGKNGVPVFFLVIAALLWVNVFLRGGTLVCPGFWPVCQLVAMGIIFGASYSLWEVGINRGNFMLLAVFSYFTPAVSMLFASLWLDLVPPAGFWAGVGLTIAGSILCWRSTLRKHPAA